MAATVCVSVALGQRADIYTPRSISAASTDETCPHVTREKQWKICTPSRKRTGFALLARHICCLVLNRSQKRVSNIRNGGIGNRLSVVRLGGIPVFREDLVSRVGLKRTSWAELIGCDPSRTTTSLHFDLMQAARVPVLRVVVASGVDVAFTTIGCKKGRSARSGW
jgi:hypothetical protein